MQLVTAGAKASDSAEFEEMLRLEILHYCAHDFSDENSCEARLYIIDLDSENAFTYDRMKSRSNCGAVFYSRNRQTVDGCSLTEKQACLLRPFTVSEFISEVKRITRLLSDGEENSLKSNNRAFSASSELTETSEYRLAKTKNVDSDDTDIDSIRATTNGNFDLRFIEDDNYNKVIFMGEKIPLTKREYDLLYYLYKNRGTPVSRSDAVNEVWHYDFTGNSNIVEVYIRYLRQKLDDKFNVKLIRTVRGCGYIIL